jgi:mannose-6-phosphate isomerase-like protein (cupin superfamily)
MKPLIAIVAILVVSVSTSVQQGAEDGVSFIPKEQVAEALANSGLLVSGPDFTVIGAHRDAGVGQPERHANVTDIYYITDGEGPLVTGGRLEGSRETRPGEMIGGHLVGGEERQDSTGDVVAIPPGIPHWYKEVPNEISCYLIKVIRPNR